MAEIDAATAAMIQNLEKQTGTSMNEWVDRVLKSGLTKHGEIVKWLKSDHGVTHGYANLIAHSALRSDASHSEGDDLIDAAFAGDKAALRPIYDRIVEACRGFGAGLEIAPKKGYVSLRRSRQFALVQPSTRTRVDVGLALKGSPPAGRLEASGSWNAMVSHRVRVGSVDEVDAELLGWLRAAFDAA